MLESILTVITSSGITALILAFLGKTWVQARVKSSIENEYKKQLELFSREQDRKEKVELVAEILAEYLNTPKGHSMTRDQRNLLNQLSFKSSLWLPSRLAKELSKRIQNTDDALSTSEIIIDARKVLLDSKEDSDIGVEHITIWGFEKETQGDGNKSE